MAEESKALTVVQRSIQERKNLTNALIQTDASGARALVIPPDLHEVYNVLAPASVLTQANTHFVPQFSVVALDPDTDFYAMTGANKGSFAMKKDAIVRLANTVGIDFSMDPGGSEFGDSVEVYLFGRMVMRIRPYRYTSIGRVRKSDGTLVGFKAERDWIPQREALEIELEAEAKDFLRKKTQAETEEAQFVYARKEFIRNLEYRSMMMKSKAQNAVMRTAFGIKQKFSKVEVQKPFFLVSYNLHVSDDADGMALISQLVGADVQNLYGRTPAALPEQVEAVTEIGGDIHVVNVDTETGEYTPAYAEAEDEENAGEPEVVGPDASEGFLEGVEIKDDKPKRGGKYIMPLPDASVWHNMSVEEIDSHGGRQFLLSVHSGFRRMYDQGTASAAQKEALENLEGYLLPKGALK